jgi:putative endonuclease
MKRPVETDWGYYWKGQVPWLYRLRPPQTTERVGRWGEWVALRYLAELGWDVVARNWKTRRGELDLVARDDKQLVVIEVRTRLGDPIGVLPEESLDREKESKVENLAFEFLRRYELWDESLRLDWIAVETSDGRDFELRHASF